MGQSRFGWRAIVVGLVAALVVPTACGASDEGSKPAGTAARAGAAGKAGASGSGGSAATSGAGGAGNDGGPDGSVGTGGLSTGGSAGIAAGGTTGTGGVGGSAAATADAPFDSPLGSCIDRDLGSLLGSPASYTVATGSAASALDDLQAPCGGSGGRDVAFQWQAPFSGAYAFFTAGSSYDTLLYLLDSSCTGAVLACDNEAYASDAYVAKDLVAGQSIVIVVDAKSSSSASWDYNLGIYGVACPEQDLGSALGNAIVTSTTSGQSSFNLSCGGYGAPERTYRWTAPKSGTFVFDTAGSSLQTVLAAFDGGCVGTELACNNVTTTGSRITLSLNAGQSIVLVVDSATSSGGSFALNAHELVCPTADLGSAVGSAVTNGTTVGASNGFVGSCALADGPEVTLRWTAPSSGAYSFDTAGSAASTVLYLLDACAGKELGCQTGFGTTGARVTARLTAGEQVIVVVESATSTGSAYVLNIAEVPCPGSDLGSALGSSIASGTTAGGPNLMSASCGGALSPDATYRWTAPNAGTFVFDTAGSAYNTVLSVFASSCAGSELACNNNVGSSTQSRVTVGLYAGQSIIVAVDGASSSASGTYILNAAEVTCPEVDLGSAVGNAVYSGTTAGQQNAFSPSCTYQDGPEVTHRWAAPSAGTYKFDTTGSALDTVLYLMDRCGGKSLTCDAGPTGSTSASVAHTFAAGEEAVLVVDSATATGGSYVLNVSTVACPESDLGSIVGSAIAVDTTAGHANAYAPSCTSLQGPEQTYRWVAPSAGLYSFDTNGSPSSMALYVLQSCSGGELACDYGYGAQVLVDLAAGQEVLLVVDSTSSSGTSFVLNIAKVNCPTADLGSALGSSVVSGTTSGAPSVLSGSCGGGGASEVTYAWTAPHSGTFQFDTIGSNLDTILYVLSGSCAGAELGCDDESGGLGTSKLSLTLSAGQKVVVVVDGYYSTGNYVLNITDQTCPDYELGQALGSSVATGTNFGKHAQLAGTCGGSTGREVTYRWTAPSTGTFSFDTFGSTYDTVLYLRGGTCTSTELACNDNSVGTASSVQASVYGGQVVIIVIDSAGTAVGDYVLNIFQK